MNESSRLICSGLLTGLFIGGFLTSTYITQSQLYLEKEESIKKLKLVNSLLDSQLTNQILINNQIYSKQNKKKEN